MLCSGHFCAVCGYREKVNVVYRHLLKDLVVQIPVCDHETIFAYLLCHHCTHVIFKNHAAAISDAISRQLTVCKHVDLDVKVLPVTEFETERALCPSARSERSPAFGGACARFSCTRVYGFVQNSTTGEKVAMLIGKWDGAMYYVLRDPTTKPRGYDPMTEALLLWEGTPTLLRQCTTFLLSQGQN